MTRVTVQARSTTTAVGPQGTVVVAFVRADTS